MKKPVIPNNEGIATLAAIKTNLDILTGRIGGELKPLSATATTSDIIKKFNEIIARLNAST